MVDFLGGPQPQQDIFGLGRLAEAIRGRRQEKRQEELDRQAAVTRELQQEGLRLGIQEREAGLQQKQQSLADLKALSDTTTQLIEAGNINPYRARYMALQKHRPDEALKMRGDIMDQALRMAKAGQGKVAAEWVNPILGTDFEFLGEKEGLMKIGSVASGTVKVYDPNQDKVIREFTFLNPEVKAGAGEGLSSKEKFSRAKNIRAEIDKASSDFNKVTDAFGRIQASVQDPSASGDLALIFNFMKMLDPGSVVREGEFATAQNAAGVPDQIKNAYNRVISGERLNPNQRQDFTSRANALFQEADTRHKSTVDSYVDLAERFGLEEGDVVVRRGRPAFEESKAQQATPQTGVPEPSKAKQAPTFVPTVTTQQEFNNLPSGSEFIEDGVRYRKP